MPPGGLVPRFRLWDTARQEQTETSEQGPRHARLFLLALRDVFGFEGFRPGQEEIVEAVAAGENVLAIMPTGGGKSLCFQLPALLREG